MSRFIPWLIRFATITLFSAACIGAPVQYEFDGSHADITFTVSHLGYSNTHGRFNEFSGTLKVDAETLSESSVEVSINTSSIETSWPKRNDHLKSEDFFNVDEFPSMTFAGTSIAINANNEGQLVGDLTMLGNTHPVTLDIRINKLAPHPRSGKMTIGITATGSLLRSQWGMDKFVPGIGDEIEIRLDMEASQSEK